MSAFITHFAFEFRTGLRNSTQLMMNYLFPLGFYVMTGLVMTQVNPGFRETMAPAMVVFVILAATMLGLPGPLVESREAGIYRSFKINGVPAASILSIPALSAVIHALIASTVVALTAAPLFGGRAPTNWLAFAGVTLLAALSCGALGALIGVMASNSRSVVLYSQLVFLPSMLIGGLMMPLTVLPAGVRPISALLPSAHAMQAFQGLAYGEAAAWSPWLAVGVLAAGGLIALALAIYLFNWDSNNATRRGHPLLALLALAPYVASLALVAG
ncbi:MAG: ABC transporter permease [Chloroflexi bacterium]|nr:ABC transporter permease [Chloroflexota bacterium]